MSMFDTTGTWRREYPDRLQVFVMWRCRMAGSMSALKERTDHKAPQGSGDVESERQPKSGWVD